MSDIEKLKQELYLEVDENESLRRTIKELEKKVEKLEEAFHKIIAELTATIPDWSASREICDSVDYDLDAFDWKGGR